MTRSPFPNVSAARRALMGRVRQEHTAPEVAVRRALHAKGYRFRLHRRDLPGSPDIVLPRHRTAIFVHGCFWHRHPDCRGASTPKTNCEYWHQKFSANVMRDARAADELVKAGWKVAIVWECEAKCPRTLENVLE
jgi:DNA mismatch endonuclease (patch repair protein)